MDGRTDMTKLIVAFSQFSKAPKKVYLEEYMDRDTYVT